MLTLKDCIELCDCDEEEILAIAEHEHIPEIVAVELAQYLEHTPEGVPMIRRFIIDDIRAAEARGDVEKVEQMRLALKHFVARHPEFNKGG
jgi:hypothetical protein